MNTKKFRTKSNTIPRDNKVIDGIWEIALDIGYSAVKIFSPNMVASFPSYAKKVNQDFRYALSAPKESILYKDLNTGEIWVVGQQAQKLMSSRETEDSEKSLYGRDRYYSPLFKVISEAGLGIAMQGNRFGEYKSTDKIVIQTGLPERYMNDERDLVDILSGPHSFALKIGNEEWKTFSFEVAKGDVFVMSQPKGTLFSVLTDKDAQYIPDAMNYLKSSVLIADPGFGTFDIFHINAGTVDTGETFADLGMKRVLQETCKLIKSEYGVEISVPAMQENLETGTVIAYDRKTRKGAEYSIESLLERANNMVCEEALTRLNSSSSFDISKIKYFIITGGTGAAWLNKFEEEFSSYPWITFIKGNQNDDLDFIYSNVRGYFNYRYNKLKKELEDKNL